MNRHTSLDDIDKRIKKLKEELRRLIAEKESLMGFSKLKLPVEIPIECYGRVLHYKGKQKHPKHLANTKGSDLTLYIEPPERVKQTEPTLYQGYLNWAHIHIFFPETWIDGVNVSVKMKLVIEEIHQKLYDSN